MPCIPFGDGRQMPIAPLQLSNANAASHHKMCFSSRGPPAQDDELFDESSKRSMCIGTYLCSLRSTLLKYLKVGMVIVSERKLWAILAGDLPPMTIGWEEQVKPGQAKVPKRRTDENVLGFVEECSSTNTTNGVARVGFGFDKEAEVEFLFYSTHQKKKCRGQRLNPRPKSKKQKTSNKLVAARKRDWDQSKMFLNLTQHQQWCYVPIDRVLLLPLWPRFSCFCTFFPMYSTYSPFSPISIFVWDHWSQYAYDSQ